MTRTTSEAWGKMGPPKKILIVELIVSISVLHALLMTTNGVKSTALLPIKTYQPGSQLADVKARRARVRHGSTLAFCFGRSLSVLRPFSDFRTSLILQTLLIITRSRHHGPASATAKIAGEPVPGLSATTTSTSQCGKCREVSACRRAWRVRDTNSYHAEPPE